MQIIQVPTSLRLIVEQRHPRNYLSSHMLLVVFEDAMRAAVIGTPDLESLNPQLASVRSCSTSLGQDSSQLAVIVGCISSYVFTWWVRNAAIPTRRLMPHRDKWGAEEWGCGSWFLGSCRSSQKVPVVRCARSLTEQMMALMTKRHNTNSSKNGDISTIFNPEPIPRIFVKAIEELHLADKAPLVRRISGPYHRSSTYGEKNMVTSVPRFPQRPPAALCSRSSEKQWTYLEILRRHHAVSLFSYTLINYTYSQSWTDMRLAIYLKTPDKVTQGLAIDSPARFGSNQTHKFLLLKNRNDLFYFAIDFRPCRRHLRRRSVRPTHRLRVGSKRIRCLDSRSEPRAKNCGSPLLRY